MYLSVRKFVVRSARTAMICVGRVRTIHLDSDHDNIDWQPHSVCKYECRGKEDCSRGQEWYRRT